MLDGNSHLLSWTILMLNNSTIQLNILLGFLVYICQCISLCGSRYEDFFGVKKTRQRKYKQYRRSDDLDMDEPDTKNQVVHEPNDDNDNDNLVINEPDEDNDNQVIYLSQNIHVSPDDLHVSDFTFSLCCIN